MHYRLATQSGVQVLSMQLGVPALVSDSGGLAEFAPDDLPPVGADDVRGLTAAFDALADPAVAAAHGRRAREHYLACFSADRAATVWGELFARIAGHRRR